MLAVEVRYAIQTRYAVERADSDPLRIADDQLPTAAQMDVSGDVDAILARIRPGSARRQPTDGHRPCQHAQTAPSATSASISVSP
jgi:hypothetical protein